MAHPKIEKRYSDGKYGQMHMWVAQPPDGADDSKIPLFCFHPSPFSARVFENFLPLIAQDRTVYAVDTPGFGEAVAPPAVPSIADYADAMNGLIHNLGYDQVDVLGTHTGTTIAMELAVAQPDLVRKVVFSGIPTFTPEQGAQWTEQVTSRPRITEDGSHLMTFWDMWVVKRPKEQSLERAADLFSELTRAGTRGHWGVLAVFQYDAFSRLKEVTQPVLVLNPHDGLETKTAEAVELIQNATFVDLPHLARYEWDIGAGDMAEHIGAFLKGS